MSQSKVDVIITTALFCDKGKPWCDNHVLKCLLRQDQKQAADLESAEKILQEKQFGIFV